MQLKFLLKTIVTVFVVVLAGCTVHLPSENTLSESEQYETIQELIAKAPKNIAERDNLPRWLSQYIDSLKPDNVREVAAYRARWKGNVVYYVSDLFSSCIMCATFTSDGEKIDWSINNSDDFLKSSTDWECIYLSKSKYHDL